MFLYRSVGAADSSFVGVHWELNFVWKKKRDKEKIPFSCPLVLWYNDVSLFT